MAQMVTATFSVGGGQIKRGPFDVLGLVGQRLTGRAKDTGGDVTIAVYVIGGTWTIDGQPVEDLEMVSV